VCPRCESKRLSFLSNAAHVEVSGLPEAIFSQGNSIFEDSPIGLDKWLCAMWLIANCRNGVSSYEIARDVKISQKSA
jgi:hypothetical protein